MRNALKKVDFDTNITLKIFDSVLKPILTYNSEIWSQLNSRQFKVLNKMNSQHERTKFIFESLFRDSETQHLKICKSILGVNRSCSNLAVLRELGRLPVVTYCLEKQFLFFYRLINMPGITLSNELSMTAVSCKKMAISAGLILVVYTLKYLE